ncbi:hypothetical protein LZ32DRAFT_53221 [Colletotrichum eremochloae]|nr:hypothetical protein LZ32DRAFT_53221 [Colletotrichum eremochloae]
MRSVQSFVGGHCFMLLGPFCSRRTIWRAESEKTWVSEEANGWLTEIQGGKDGALAEGFFFFPFLSPVCHFRFLWRKSKKDGMTLRGRHEKTSSNDAICVSEPGREGGGTCHFVHGLNPLDSRRARSELLLFLAHRIRFNRSPVQLRKKLLTSLACVRHYVVDRRSERFVSATQTKGCGERISSCLESSPCKKKKRGEKKTNQPSLGNSPWLAR